MNNAINPVAANATVADIPLTKKAQPLPQVEMLAVTGIADIVPGDDLALEIQRAMQALELQLEDGDILVIAHKVVSKAEGQIVDLTKVNPSAKALELAEQLNKNPAKVEVVLSESKRIVRASKRPEQEEGLIIAEHRLGFICANAAVDESNVDSADHVILLPVDPDASARQICSQLEAASNKRLGVVITDTFGRPWRMGLVNVAIGLANVPSKVDMAGGRDAYGRELRVTVPALADELAAASGLLMSKEGKRPLIIFRGVDWSPTKSSASDLIRPSREDLFKC
ncbi:MAG: coenzyme F420-dependent oxidoreductase [Osedax symbiont Rs2]|nr:MAG: coenzyme F420-dependent oxidoreductase [Osedax symbiont Rs2]